MPSPPVYLYSSGQRYARQWQRYHAGGMCAGLAPGVRSVPVIGAIIGSQRPNGKPRPGLMRKALERERPMQSHCETSGSYQLQRRHNGCTVT